jgi:gamma-glutamylcyclotransferase (GGCT)/AIG2-like uncharacterized protein YtfP
VEAKRAIAFGQLFDLSLGYPAMTHGESPVQGFLLTFDDPTVLSILDELEDYDPHRLPQENEYNRQQIETYTLEEQALGPAWAYLMTFEQVQRLEGIPIPSGWWISRVETAHSLKTSETFY